MKEKYDIEKELSSMEKEYRWVCQEEIIIESSSVGSLINFLSQYNSDDYRIEEDYDNFFIMKKELESDEVFEERKENRKRYLERENDKLLSKEEKERAKFERLKAAYEILKEKFEPNS